MFSVGEGSGRIGSAGSRPAVIDETPRNVVPAPWANAWAPRSEPTDSV